MCQVQVYCRLSVPSGSLQTVVNWDILYTNVVVHNVFIESAFPSIRVHVCPNNTTDKRYDIKRLKSSSHFPFNVHKTFRIFKGTPGAEKLPRG